MARLLAQKLSEGRNNLGVIVDNKPSAGELSCMPPLQGWRAIFPTYSRIMDIINFAATVV